MASCWSCAASHNAVVPREQNEALIKMHTVRLLTREHAKRTSESEIPPKLKINNNIIKYNIIGREHQTLKST